MPNSKKPDDKAKTTAEENKDAVGTAAQPKPPEPGSVGLENGKKVQSDEVPAGVKTNVAENASIADGNERVATRSGEVVAKDDLPEGTKLVGQDETVGSAPAADERDTSTVEGAKLPSELNASPTSDPLINNLFNPSQAPSPELGYVEPGKTVLDEHPGNVPDDERLRDLPAVQYVAVKAVIQRIEAAQKFGQRNALDHALNDARDILGPLDMGQASGLRTWVDGIKEDVLAQDEKDAIEADKKVQQEPAPKKLR